MAASATGLLAFFTQMDNQGGVIVKEPPKLDLDLYVQSYQGRTRFERLFLIGRTSVTLCVDALKAAVQEAKTGLDVDRYIEAWECIRIAAPSEPEAVYAQTWVEETRKANKLETARLEQELKGYRNNLIKESIRMGNEDLGKHYESIGNLTMAADAYGRMRSDVSTAKHLIDVGKHLVKISIQRREWSMVLANLSKVTGVPGSSEDDSMTQPFARIARGLGLLGQDRYDEAARCFLEAESSIPAAEYNDIASPNDVAVYGGLLALATMSREALQASVLDNQNFRNFLELEPHIRKAISLFVNGRYSACLAILELYRPDYLLDIYLQKHVPVIYARIRSKCIVQYFAAFSCVTLDSLNEAFAPKGQSVEQELAGMIRSGALNARINTIDRLLTAVTPNPRTAMAVAGMDAAKMYEKEALERVRRLSVAAAELEVKGSKRTAVAGPPGMGSNDRWYEETMRTMYPVPPEEA